MRENEGGGGVLKKDWKVTAQERVGALKRRGVGEGKHRGREVGKGR